MSNHSTQNLQAHNEVGSDLPSNNIVSDDRQQQKRQASQETSQRDNAGGEMRKKLVMWPTTAARKEWEQFDREVDQVLESVLAGDIGRKMKAMSTIIWNMGAERFGMEQRRTKGSQHARENRRSREIAKLRGDLRRLKKAFLQASEDEKPALKEMRDHLRERIKTLRRAECQRRDRRRREKESVNFTKNPFKYLSGLLGVKRSGVLKASNEEVEEHLRKVHSDPRRVEDLDLEGRLCCPEEPTIPFDDGELKWQEVNDFIRKARGRSAPGPNGIPYRVYKNCERLRRRLWRLLKVVRRKNHLPGSSLPRGVLSQSRRTHPA